MASATAQICASFLRAGRPRRLRLSGLGNVLNFDVHSLQYTFSCVWTRYQRQPHPSQTFSCTRTSMTGSPCCCSLYPAELCSSGCSPGCREPGQAVQISPVLTEDCHPCSPVVCHEFLCADPGISRPACFPGAPDRAAPRWVQGKPEHNKMNRQLFIPCMQRQ
jgi:hypothetical protein